MDIANARTRSFTNARRCTPPRRLGQAITARHNQAVRPPMIPAGGMVKTTQAGRTLIPVGRMVNTTRTSRSFTSLVLPR
jgi:hypothetical protein